MSPFKSIQEFVSHIVSLYQFRAAIFDLDGTLIDNNAYHLKAWKEYLKEKRMDVSEENYRKHINGRTNKDAIEYLYGRSMSNEEAYAYALEKEALYRKIYAPYIKPVNGLIPLLEAFKRENIKMAIATSGIPVNIDFMFNHIPIKSYFNTVIHSGNIKKGKPDPEIYLKAAEALKIPAQHCIAFEDAAVGIQSAKTAGMYAIGLTTTQEAEELKKADLIINDFSIESINKVWDGDSLSATNCGTYFDV